MNLAAYKSEVDLLDKTRNDPVWFCEHQLRLTGAKFYLDEWQREFIESIGDAWRKKRGLPTKYNHKGSTMITVRAMHGPGKSFLVAAIMHWFNNAFRGRIICTAPKERQLQTRLWPAFRKIAAHAGQEYSAALKIDKTKITWHGDDDWCAIAETASQPENLAGYHDDYLMFVVDEASGVNEQMFAVIEGAVSTGKLALLILIGNPTRNQGTFHASHCIPKVAQHYHQIHVSLDKTTRVDREWVKRMEDKYGRNSPVVKVRCYGEFADTDEAQLIPYAWITEAAGRDASLWGLSRRRISLDVADGGDNYTVATVALLYDTGEVEVLAQRQFSFPPSEAPILSAQAAEQMFKEFNCRAASGDDIVVDALGVGAGAAGYLMQRGLPVVAYRGGESSDDPARWRNRRSQSYIVLRDLHRDGKISYADGFLAPEEWDEFTAQLCAVRTKPGGDRVEELESKQAMMARGIASPDRADSLAMLCATQMPQTPVQLDTIAVGQMASAEAW